jgi:putative aminopeptidase FrvX
MKLLEELCSIHAPSSEEVPVKQFILNWINENKASFAVQPQVVDTPDMQDCLMLVFGKPRTAVFAHMDSTGYTVRYHNELICIGGPDGREGDELVGYVDGKKVEGLLKIVTEDEKCYFDGSENLPQGTSLTFKPKFLLTPDMIVSPYLDNRLGVWVALQLAKTLENGVLVFTCNEEHGGGCVEKLARVLFHDYKIMQALICDITWATERIFRGHGTVVSLRDKLIPRRSYVNRICSILEKNNISFQKEVESSGSSDGAYLQRCPFPIDWCFVGIPEEGSHSSGERASVSDVEQMVKVYKILMNEL